MNKLLIAVALFALGLWIWSEYFRAIPHLEQAGILKNFQVEPIEAHKAEYRVISKKYYGPERRTIHPASPVVGSFNDLAYISNIDLLLAQPETSMAALKSWQLKQSKRCFEVNLKDAVQADSAPIPPALSSLSVVASSEAVADKIRRLKAGQRIRIQGDWITLKYVKNQQEFYVGLGSQNSSQCRLFRLNAVERLD